MDKRDESFQRSLHDPSDDIALWYGTQRSHGVKEQIHRWLTDHSYSDFLSAMETRIVGQIELPYICMSVYKYLKCIDEELPVSTNMIIAGPSGCGKTETYRALKDYFNKCISSMPVCISDASQITASGYRGPEPTDILLPFFEKR